MLFCFFQLSNAGAAAPNPAANQSEEPVGYLNMGFSAPPPSSPLSSRGVEDMSHQRPTCHNPNMRREQDRLDSFHSWTVPVITPAELAKAGFYYLGQGDRVACFSCGGQVCINTVAAGQTTTTGDDIQVTVYQSGIFYFSCLSAEQLGTR